MSDQGGGPPPGMDPWGRETEYKPYGDRPIPPYDPPPPPDRTEYDSPVQPAPQPPPYGQTVYDPAAHGQPSSGQPAYGQPPYGQVPYGQAYGQTPYAPVVPYAQPVYYVPPQPPTDGLAIGAMVCGIAGLMVQCCAVGFTPFGVLGLLVGATATVLGFVARRRIHESGGSRGGAGMATAGLVCGLCATATGLILTVLAIAWVVFNLFQLS